MRYFSVCSGIEAATVAWRPLGWEAAAFSEIEAFPRAVLQHHYPDTPLHGDFTTIKGDEYGPVDLLVGGTPCQSFSVAGLRGGLADERGNLALEYLRLADRSRPRWLVWENVPGVLSSNDGRDFGTFLGGLAELGYGFAYRVLDAQFFGVPQRRRRVFVVGYLGDWRRAAAVLFERHSLSGNPAPRREAGQAVAGVLTSRASGGGGGPGAGTDEAAAGYLQAVPFTRGAHGSYRDGIGTLQAEGGDAGLGSETLIAHSLRAEGFDASEDGTGRGTPLVPVHCVDMQGGKGRGQYSEDVSYALGSSHEAHAIAFTAKDHGADASDISPTLRSGSHSGSHANGGVMPAVAFAQNSRDEVREMPYAGALSAEAGMKQTTYIRQQSAVRRLTPRECERLQGFPEIENELRILVCQNEDEKIARAKYAEQHSTAPSLAPHAPVAVDVRIDLERQQAQLLNRAKSPWFASIAGLAGSSHLPINPDAFAQLLALTHGAVGHSAQLGREASPASIKPSTHRLSGSASVLLYGQEISALASDADRFTAALAECLKSTTSQLGATPPNLGSLWTTLACCVATASVGSFQRE